MYFQSCLKKPNSAPVEAAFYATLSWRGADGNRAFMTLICVHLRCHDCNSNICVDVCGKSAHDDMAIYPGRKNMQHNENKMALASLRRQVVHVRQIEALTHHRVQRAQAKSLTIQRELTDIPLPLHLRSKHFDSARVSL